MRTANSHPAQRQGRGRGDLFGLVLWPTLLVAALVMPVGACLHDWDQLEPDTTGTVIDPICTSVCACFPTIAECPSECQASIGSCTIGERATIEECAKTCSIYDFCVEDIMGDCGNAANH